MPSLIVCTLLVAAVAADPDATAPPVAITLLFENDGTVFKPNHRNDGHYTSGQMVLLSHEPRWADDLADALGLTHTRTGAGYVLGQQIFTPEDIDRAALVPDDRPYAGHLFVGAYWQRVNDATLDHVQFDLGATGEWSLAEDAQNRTHDLIHSARARGWDHQIGNEITAQLTLRRKWRIPLLKSDTWGADAIPSVGVGLGTVKRQLGAGGVLRFGWRLPEDFGPIRLDDLAGGPTSRQHGLSAYVYTRAGGRAVFHDAFIDGPEFRAGPGTRVESAPFVGEFEAGFSLRYQHDRCAVELGYAQVFTTGAFRDQPGGDEWAAVRASVLVKF